MANFKSTYFVIECPVGEEFISGGNSKTNGLYSSKGKAVHYIKRAIGIYEKSLASNGFNEKHRDHYLKMIEYYKSLKVTEVQIVKI